MSLLADPIFKKYGERIMEAIEEELKIKGYPPNDYFLDVARDRDIRVYCMVVKLPRDKFFKKYLGTRRVNLGNMCELEIPRIPTDEDNEFAIKQHDISPDRVVGYDRIESRLITAREIISQTKAD